MLAQLGAAIIHALEHLYCSINDNASMCINVHLDIN
jgi:hypothetical protein